MGIKGVNIDYASTHMFKITQRALRLEPASKREMCSTDIECTKFNCTE